MAKHKLTSPAGTTVEVDSADRRNILLARGYTEAKSETAKPAAKPTK